MSRVFFSSLLFFLVILPREPWSGTARLDVASARALATHGAIDLPADLSDGTQIHGGRRWALEPLGPALLLAPVELALLLAPHSESGARAARIVEAVSAAVGAALLCALFFASLLTLQTRRRTAVWLTVGLAASTTIAVYARLPDGSVWSALLLLCGVEAARRWLRIPSPHSARLLGAAVGALVLFDLSMPAMVLLAFAIVFVPARRPLLWTLPGLAIGLTLALLHRHLAAAPPEAAGDLLEGLDGLLLSTGKSVFAYSPPLIIGALALPWWWRTRRSDAILRLSVAAALIVPLAALERWDGDPAWGPRRLVPLVPILLAPAGPWLDEKWAQLRRLGRASLTLVFVAGFFVQLLGAAFPPETYLRIAAAVKNGSGANGWFATSDQTHFIPQFSPIVGHAWLLSHLVRNNKKLDVATPWKLIVPTTPKLDAEWPKVRLDWWALSLSRATVPK